ncbi:MULTISPECIES: substrate-binding periplasmic protein [Aliiglaciecola]|uniref:substrate-binding periplasmic protein n=1 Tax=Aliiglaciecola TaxID=1406885 RepID=UPI001C09746B|nr:MULTISPECIES: transporter substrate-binding domain-containing protein [Aliiglaciecola]MBU2878562.1 transporter substrate-binding domain-containing protein [Aliiglaciecola lipolytica]MDO6709610.1 transporter substrate-binding domain-containing protein [Aliiglaciecola sp. 2_MG-2023]MDO6750848.1 transporter substrate-binding domain-containing protein [Aliiglaciecola sp. 1_MG-2023]
MGKKLLILVALVLCSTMQTQRLYAQDVSIEVLTDVWAPYINPESEPMGRAAKVLDTIAAYAQANVKWRYVPYRDAALLLEKQKAQLGYPYFYTQQRAEKHYYSKPIFYLTSRLYFNRHFVSSELANNNYESLKIAKVAGYSYGEKIDSIVTDGKQYETEEDALIALLNNEVQILPMTEGVMNNLLDTRFSEQKQLIIPVDEVKDESSLHIIASKTAEGKALIEKFDQAITMRLNGEDAQLQPTQNLKQQVDLATLVTSEGFPAILGEFTNQNGDIDYYTIPIGTKVIVLQWSSKILKPSHSDRIYKNMMETSKVVILNGPHVGKELRVKNMHIQLEP